MKRIDFRHLPLRITLPLLIFVVMLAGLSVSLYLTDHQYKQDMISRTTNSALSEVARLVRLAESNPEHAGVGIEREIMLYSTSGHPSTAVALVAPDGTVIFASRPEWKQQTMQRVLPAWNQARFERVIHSAGVDLQWDEAQSRLSVMMSFSHASSAERGAMLLEYDLNDALQQASQKNLLLRLPSIATVVILTLLLMFWLHRRVAVPMTRLTQAAKRIGSGDLGTPVPVHGVAEVYDMAQSLNLMSGQLASDRAALAEARQILEQRLQRARAENAMISQLLMSAAIGRGDFRAFSWALTEMLSRHFEVARVNIWRFGEEDSLLYCVDHFDATTQTHSQGLVLHEAEYADEFSALKNATYIDASDALSDPRVAGYIETYIKPYRIRSMLDVVLRLGDRMIGVCCLEHVDRQHDWQPDEIRFACQVGTLLSSVADEEERHKTEAAVASQNEALQMMASGRPLAEILTALVRAMELQFPGMLASVLLMDDDGVHLRHGAAPSLPPEYCHAIDGVAIGDNVGSCGTAAWRGQQVIVEDIARDPLWVNYRDLALKHGLRACWSTPIISSEKRVLGTFAIYYSSPMRPSPQQLRLIGRTVHTAAIAILHHKNESTLRKLSQAVEQSPESIVITDLDGRIEYVNAAFTRNTGYTREEVLGRNPRLRKSGKTPPATIEKMWATLRHGEVWQGEFINSRKDGSERIEQATIAPIRDASGATTHFLAVQLDVTEERRSEQQVHRLAYFDTLTGLANRVQLIQRMGELQKEPAIHRHGLMLIDLDRFKNINNARGHALGDEMLKVLATRLSGLLRANDLAARLSADEFAVLLTDIGDDPDQAASQLLSLAESAQHALHQPIHIEADEIAVTTSVGITLFQGEAGDGPIDTLRRADTALHRAKDAGGNQVMMFDDSMEQAMQQHFQVERDLRKAIPGGELRLYLQPQVNAAGKLTGAEALVRWQHPERGLVPPVSFIPVAEESDLIVELDRWVFASVCRLMAGQDMAGCPVRLSVNISPRHFRKPGFVAWIRQTLTETGADPTQLTLEVTEGLVIDNVSEVIGKMSELSALGMHFSIDDFGTGYSSLAYLKRLPIHELKIDKTFVQDAPTDPDDAALVEVILAVASHLHLKVVAEGVETLEQVEFLNRRGQVIHQGYYFGRPEPAENLVKRCRESKT